VDDIVEDTPCKLVIPYGRKLDKFREVGTAMELMGRVFPNPPPPEYAWVQVVSVSDESCEIDIRTEESFSVMRGTNTYCGIIEISYLMHHQERVPH
jgi:hypothetical protein